MNLTFDSSVNPLQRRWTEDAVAGIAYPLADLTVDVLVTAVSEPSCDGHKDVMCTHDDGGSGWVIEIRDGIENAAHPLNAWLPPGTNMQAYFEECIAHEMGHVVSFHFADTDPEREGLAAHFTRHDDSDGTVVGALADWNPLDKPWEDRVQEGVAEAFKDAFFDGRVFDNRTHWDTNEADFPALLTNFDQAPVGGSSGSGPAWDYQLSGKALGAAFGEPTPEPGYAWEYDHNWQTYDSAGGLAPTSAGYPGPYIGSTALDPDDWDDIQLEIACHVNVGGYGYGDPPWSGGYAPPDLAVLFLEVNIGDVIVESINGDHAGYWYDPWAGGPFGNWRLTLTYGDAEARAIAELCAGGSSCPFTVVTHFWHNLDPVGDGFAQGPGWNPNGNPTFPMDNVQLDWSWSSVGAGEITAEAPYPYGTALAVGQGPTGVQRLASAR